MNSCSQCGQRKIWRNNRWICRPCRAEYLAKWRKSNTARAREGYRQTYYRHRVQLLEKARIKNARPDIKARRAEYMKKYQKENRAVFKMRKALRRAREQQHTVLFSCRERLIEIYNGCPAGHHVDHIVPLNGKNVSGLHVPWNLQYLPIAENIKKGNRL